MRYIKLYYLILAFTYVSTLNAQNFIEKTTAIEGVDISSVAFSDVDLDGDQDVFVMGYGTDGLAQTKLYSNDGQANFTEDITNSFIQLVDGSVACVDVDNDGDDDMIITGFDTGYIGHTKMYLNNGGIFSLSTTALFDDVYGGSIVFSDYDNDMDQDVYITGLGANSVLTAQLYENDGQGIFSKVVGTPFQGSYSSKMTVSDIDNDGDEDVLITGYDNSWTASSILYTNDGGIFNEVKGTSFVDITFGMPVFADVDGDGDNDVLITGQMPPQFIPKTVLYLNNNGVFTEDQGNSFTQVDWSAAAFSDIDMDGDPDVLISGMQYLGSQSIPATILYENDGNGVFSVVSNEPFENLGTGALAFTDMDGNGVEDVLLTGYDGTNKLSRLYLNTNSTVSTRGEMFEKQLHLFPNPAQDIINFKSENPVQQIRVLSIKGKVIQQYSIGNSYNFELEIQNISNGLYFIECITNHESYTLKLTIMK